MKIKRLKDGRCKPVAIYTKEGKYVKSFPSALATAEGLNYSIEHIHHVVNRKYRCLTAGGYMLRYHVDGKIPVITKQDLNQLIRTHSGIVVWVVKNNQHIKLLRSVKEAEQYTGIPYDIIRKYLKGKIKSGDSRLMGYDFEIEREWIKK